MRRIKVALVVLGVASCALTAMAAGVFLPYENSFETAIGTGWAEGGGALSNATARVGDTGTKALYVEEETGLDIETGYKNIWSSFYTRMTPFENDGAPDIDDAAAAFFLKENGTLWAYHSNDFIQVKSGLETNEWHGFAVHINFTNKTWALYHKGESIPHNDNFTVVNLPSAMPLLLNTNFSGSQITKFEIAGETLLDHFEMKRSVQTLSAELPAHDKVANAEALLEGSASAVSFEFIEGESGTILGALGDALADMFNAGDQLVFWDPSANDGAGGFFTATLDGNGEWSTTGDADFTIKPTTGMFVRRAGETRTLRMMRSYSTSYTHVGMDVTPVGTGWNLLAVPMTAGARQVSTLGLPVAQNDQMFLRDGSRWVILRWTGTQWVRGAAPADDYEFPAGRSFWLRRLTGGGALDWPSLN